MDDTNRSDGHWMIRVDHVSKIYRGITSKQTTTAIQNISLQVVEGERVAILGPTGCGKSTFFRLLSGLESPTSGEVEVMGRNPRAEFNWYRGRIGLIFQEARLLPWRTALQNVRLALEFLDPPPEQPEERSRQWLERLGLGESLYSYPGELSGGMRQRVAIARAFAPSPGLVLADEPFSRLDRVTAARLRKDFLELCEKRRLTLILITHRIAEALEMANRVLVFGKPGQLEAEVFARPGSIEQDRATLEQALATSHEA